ncbi:CBS domain-containing protein [Rhodoferax sp. TBRC 17660]|uniref:CBS domain-containing protein n=1 Tax=Rhodoferax potami TaxID=3068338 RepID=A0ABU3KK72_9BURK|nr:CBS domain-containing protein [Rhodoferax sp. TBRC 17660]MDT7518146.1 CBS domain-containing protein [Rhodoferax sp. TBRC 17660]
MFSVYGTAGQIFRGSLEELGKVSGIRRAARTRRIEALGVDAQDHNTRRFADALNTPAYEAPATDIAHRTALAAYGEVRKPAQTRQPLTRVADIMSLEVVTVSDTYTIEDAWALLNQHGIAQAPVVSAEGVLVGLLTRAELTRAEHLPQADAHALVWRAFLAQSVQEVMWTPVPSVAADTDIRRLARVLLDTGLPGLPVVDEEGAVRGFVSRSDILRAVVADPPLDLWT